MITVKEAKNITKARQTEILQEKLKFNEKLLEAIEDKIKSAASIGGWSSIDFYFTGNYYVTISDMEFIEYYLTAYGFKTKLHKDERDACYIEISWE